MFLDSSTGERNFKLPPYWQKFHLSPIIYPHHPHSAHFFYNRKVEAMFQRIPVQFTELKPGDEIRIIDNHGDRLAIVLVVDGFSFLTNEGEAISRCHFSGEVTKTGKTVPDDKINISGKAALILLSQVRALLAERRLQINGLLGTQTLDKALSQAADVIFPPRRDGDDGDKLG